MRENIIIIMCAAFLAGCYGYVCIQDLRARRAFHKLLMQTGYDNSLIITAYLLMVFHTVDDAMNYMKTPNAKLDGKAPADCVLDSKMMEILKDELKDMVRYRSF